MLALHGRAVSTGWPRSDDAVGVWGKRPVAWRGEWIARQSRAPLIRLEDGFLRSLNPGVSGEPPISLILDDIGIYYDASRPSRLEHLLSQSDLTEGQRARADAGINALRNARISKYTPALPPRSIGADYVLVIDQTYGDASVYGAGACERTFQTMLSAARFENPHSDLVIKSHPDAAVGKRRGYFSQSDVGAMERLLTEPINPWDAMAGAKIVYTVSSQMGYEAVLMGKPVRCFGQAFYSGWGLTIDENPVTRRSVRLDRSALFYGCHISYPIYYDPWRDALCDYETALDVLAHQRDAAIPVDGVEGEVFCGVRRWKRDRLSRFRPNYKKSPVYEDDIQRAIGIATAEKRQIWAWASKVPCSTMASTKALNVDIGYIEDGFLRSVGLGAALTQASSLVFDRQGIYFDPSSRSDLEDLITCAVNGAADRQRAAQLRKLIVASKVTKYNTGAELKHTLPTGKKVLLVPGQVEDDASILRGCGAVRTNLGLLEAARTARPDAWILYKPHPDVEAGLRAGRVTEADLAKLADGVLSGVAADTALDQVDELWTLTSLMGFEALLRGISVTCLGAPFYAGWGLTTDLGPSTPRRTAKPDLDDLVWAALIAYPSYRAPMTGLPCTPEVIVEHLSRRDPSPRANVLSRLQGLFARQSWIWR